MVSAARAPGPFDEFAKLAVRREQLRRIHASVMSQAVEPAAPGVEPLRLEGGFLTAYDLRTAEVRTFTVARITGVAAVADPGR